MHVRSKYAPFDVITAEIWSRYFLTCLSDTSAAYLSTLVYKNSVESTLVENSVETRLLEYFCHFPRIATDEFYVHPVSWFMLLLKVLNEVYTVVNALNLLNAYSEYFLEKS